MLFNQGNQSCWRERINIIQLKEIDKCQYGDAINKTVQRTDSSNGSFEKDHLISSNTKVIAVPSEVQGINNYNFKAPTQSKEKCKVMKPTGNTALASSSLSSKAETMIIPAASSSAVKLPWLQRTDWWAVLMGCSAGWSLSDYPATGLNTGSFFQVDHNELHPPKSQVIVTYGRERVNDKSKLHFNM